MGFFSKEKMTIDQLVEKLAIIALNSIADDSLKAYQMVLKDMGESIRIDARQKREIFTIELLATTLAIQKMFTNRDESKRILDALYIKIYAQISESDSDQLEFEEFINVRFRTYYQILSSKSEFTHFSFGKQFADYLLGRDVMDGLALIATASDIFLSNTKGTEEFIKELLSKYDFVK